MSNSSEVSQNGQIVRDNGSTAKRINNLLNSSKTRLEGLQFLNLFLPQCPDEDFRHFCISWMQNCCKLDGLTNNRNCAARLLRDLLKISSNYPELKKSVSFFITTRYFDYFFKHFLNSESGWTCTETCLLLYRAACGQFQEGLEKHLTKEIERGVMISSTMGRCFALLPCLGGGGNEGVNYKRNWKSQFVKFLNVCHSVLNDLYVDVEDVQEHGTRPHSKNKRERNVDHLAVQLHNYSNVLGFMLLNPYPAPKNVPSDLVFQLICRGLALNPRSAGKFQTVDAVSLQNVLPDIHGSLISLLKALIVTCKNQLLPYSHLIGKLIKQSLQWTESDVNYGSEKPFHRLRTTAYETLCDWLTVARGGSCMELISDVVVSIAVNDIRPKKGVVFLKEGKLQNQAKHLSPQAIRKIGATPDGQLCLAALRALQFLLKFSGVLLKPEVHKFLQEVVVELLVEVQKSPELFVVAPFAEPACRLELYSLLLELVHQPCLKWPPPTNFALRLFGRGVNDVSPRVSSFCSTALNFATTIIHPQYDNGGFPSSIHRDGRRRAEEEPKEAINDEALPLFSAVEDETVPGESNSSAGGRKENWREPNETDADEVSEVSSDEDSRNTIAFSKDFEAAAKEPLGAEDGNGREVSPRGSVAEAEDESGAKRRKTEDPTREEAPSLAGESSESENSPPVPREPPERPENGKTKKPVEKTHARESSGPESCSPESTNEDSHPKARYFLRSKTVGSSEEPEETLRGTSSPESSRGTPAKNLAKTTPSVQNSKKRPRTRALSKVEGSVEAEGKTPGKNMRDDEEDIRAAFDDSFVD